MNTINIITLAPLNTWQHFRNLQLHLATPKGFNNSAFPIALYETGCRDQEKDHIIKITNCTEMDFKKSQLKIAFCEIHTHLQISSRHSACLLGFSSLGLHRTGYVFSRAGG